MHAPNACRWPPYASHLAFELWELGTARAPALRLLFNGQPVTAYLRGCDTAAAASGHGRSTTATHEAGGVAASRLAALEFCPLAALEAEVAALRADFRATCETPAPAA